MYDQESDIIGDLEFAYYARMCMGEMVSGDTVVVQARENRLFIAMVDVLGHGQSAHELATRIQAYLEADWQADVIDTMQNLHEHISGSLGAAAGLACLDMDTGELRYAGVGNTVVRKFGLGSDGERLPSSDGVVGSRFRRPTEYRLIMEESDILVFYTDGISDRFRLDDYPRIVYESARSIARNVVRKFGKQYDDATCLVVRNRK